MQRKQNKVINYHHVLPDEYLEPNLLFGYTHSLSNFKAQLSFLARRFGFTNNFKDGSGKAVITFDDGALNTFLYALPELEKIKAKAYFFIVNDNEVAPLWIDRYFAWISYVPNGTYSLFNKDFYISSTAQRLALHGFLWNEIKQGTQPQEILTHLEAVYSFENITQKMGPLYRERMERMNQNHLQELAKRGHFIGGHSITHPIFKTLSESQLKIENPMGDIFNTTAMAVPFGTSEDVTPKNIDLLVSLGYDPIVLNQEKPIHSKTIGRINLPNSSDPYEWHFYLSGLKTLLQG